ncbi:Predicted Fe-Mo cluster-binding protein, NifX family [Natronincola peptidivorans]|uniref:Predicted Fe-Mo cluster-binding protein, NifX family n=1 Tax=Natronincola peptidivorans TaxID=426128 RepID=A0A1I0DQ80_9FIRM|nr:NifB/NifX family molybdenum-iron cluster-binding protein [Natronincola peptidivorans]SET34080.1 Predicted Fe-Mo cluster-binding protein, NifX family [Natronincola peptidivorans]
MKIVLPVDDKNMETDVCISFGRTPYFLIFDTESKESTFLANHAANSQGGAGIKAAQAIVDQKVDALLAPRCGKNAAEVISAAEIKMYKTMNNSIMDNINAFNDGKLALLEDIHAGFHGVGGR